MNENELAIVKIISSSGESKAKAFEALKCVKTKEFNKARELIKESRHLDLEAHNMQTQWIQQEMSQNNHQLSEINQTITKTMDQVFEKLNAEIKRTNQKLTMRTAATNLYASVPTGIVVVALMWLLNAFNVW